MGLVERVVVRQGLRVGVVERRGVPERPLLPDVRQVLLQRLELWPGLEPGPGGAEGGWGPSESAEQPPLALCLLPKDGLVLDAFDVDGCPG